MSYYYYYPITSYWLLQQSVLKCVINIYHFFVYSMLGSTVYFCFSLLVQFLISSLIATNHFVCLCHYVFLLNHDWMSIDR